MRSQARRVVHGGLTVTEDDGLCLHSVWAGPVELYRSEMLEGWAIDKCYAAAELDEREVAEEV